MEGLEHFLQLEKVASKIEFNLVKRLENFKRRFFKTAFSFFLLIFAIAFFLIGMALFLSRFFSLDYVFIFLGLVLFYVALLLRLSK